jgi:hypothetical protein
MDANGLSDPYARLYYGDRCVWTTAVKPKTLEPTWEQSKEFSVRDLRRVRFTVRVHLLYWSVLDPATASHGPTPSMSISALQSPFLHSPSLSHFPSLPCIHIHIHV